MQYYDLSIKKLHFIVTPQELRSIMRGFHHVVVNAGVRKGYIESNPNDFFLTYDTLYQKLKNGEKLIWEKDYDIVSFSTGVTAHLENCIYQPNTMLNTPHFAEPCPYIETFRFRITMKEELSTSYFVGQFSENVCGLCLSFPSKVEYEKDTQKHPIGIVNQTELDDFATYEELVARIKAITKPLRLEFNGKVHRTSVRISNDAKADFENFYFAALYKTKIV